MSLYQRLLGADYDRLPPVLRAFHAGPGIVRGRVRITRGAGGPLRHLAAALARLPPPAEDADVTLTVTPEGSGERWERRFGGARLDTRQWEKGGRLWERLGPLTLVLSVVADERGLTFGFDHVRVLGARLPKALSPWTDGWAYSEGDGWRVRTEIGAPLLGIVTTYEGFVRPDPSP